MVRLARGDDFALDVQRQQASIRCGCTPKTRHATSSLRRQRPLTEVFQLNIHRNLVDHRRRSAHYDSMIAKLIVTGGDRADAV
jgi:biotin carboxylase